MPRTTKNDGPAGYLTVNALSKSYPGVVPPAVAGISLTVGRGEFLALLGPSGCGKTTTLRMIAGLVEPTSGSLLLDGRDITYQDVHRRGMGMVFQNYALFPHLDVGANVAYGLRMRKTPKSEIRDRVTKALELVQLGHLAERKIAALSGGQQQRVALARALVVEPTVLLMDEPLSNLDAKLRDAMRNDIREIQQRLGITAVFVTHDQTEALTMADQVAVMSHGNLEQVGSPADIFDRPATKFVAQFVGRTNFITGTVTSKDSSGARVDVPGGGGHLIVPSTETPVGAEVTYVVRPHQLSLGRGDDTSGLQARVLRATYLGDAIQYELAVGQETATGQETLIVDQIAGIGTPATPGDLVMSTSGQKTSMFCPNTETPQRPPRRPSRRGTHMPIEENPNGAPVDPELLEKLKRLSFPTIGHYLERGFVDTGIRTFLPGSHIVGRAVTVRITSLDSALMHRAVALLSPGDVLVIDTGGDRTHAPVGLVVAYAARHLGASAILIDGVMTDVREVADVGMPVFARGTSVLTTKLLGLPQGGVNVPVTIGGQVVNPGDLVLADDNGVLVLPVDDAAQIVDQALQSDIDEPALLRNIDAGIPLPNVTVANAVLAQALSGSRP